MVLPPYWLGPCSTPHLEELMLAILAAVAFLLAAFGVTQLGIVNVLALGLALLALHLVVPVTVPWRTAPRR